MKMSCAAGLGMAAVLLTLMAVDESKADAVVPRKCGNGVCGSVESWGGRVRIQLSAQLTRLSHYSFKTNPGAQIELGPGGAYSFEHRPGESGTYSAQACGRSTFSPSVCTRWTTFTWRS